MASKGFPKPVLKEGALYWADNGRIVCRKCAGCSALYTGRDISGQKVTRITVDEVHGWHQTMGESHDLMCDGKDITLSCLAGPDGWPLWTRA